MQAQTVEVAHEAITPGRYSLQDTEFGCIFGRTGESTLVEQLPPVRRQGYVCVESADAVEACLVIAVAGKIRYQCCRAQRNLRRL